MLCRATCTIAILLIDFFPLNVKRNLSLDTSNYKIWFSFYFFYYHFDRKSIFFQKISSNRCHSQGFLWDVHFGRHFISQHAQDNKQKLTREGMGNLYQTPKAIQLKLETSQITKTPGYPTFLWSYESVVPI